MTSLARRSTLTVFASALAAATWAGCAQPSHRVEETSLGRAEAVMQDSSTYDARDVRRAADGGWWVLANAEPFVRRYDRAGLLVARHGRKGRGPTDMIRPWLFVGSPGDETPPLIWDVGRKVLISVDTLGQVSVVGSLVGALGPVRNDIETVTFGNPFQARSDGRSIVFAQYAGEISNTIHLARPTVFRLRSDSGTVDTIVSVRQSAEGNRPKGIAMSLVPIPLWDLCPDSTIAFLDAGGAVVYRIGVSGDTVSTAALPAADRMPRPFALDAVERHVRHLLVNEFLSFGRDTATVGAEAQRIARDFRADYPEHEPAFVRLVCDTEARVWLQRFSLATNPVGYGSSWLILDGSGRSRSVSLPPGFSPVQILAGEAIGLMEDHDGATWPARLVFQLER